jgi:hypothetical protein
MLSQDGFYFLGLDHGLVTPETDWDFNVIASNFMGILGEAHILDEPKGRNLNCELIFNEYNSRYDLYSDLLTINQQVSYLVDDLTVTIGGDVTVFPQCTFLGILTDPKGPFLDGSGQNGWILFSRLRWRQRTWNEAQSS